MMLFAISACLATLAAVDGGIYTPKHGSLLTPGVKDYHGLPVPVKLVKVTNTVAVPLGYPLHAARTGPFPIAVRRPVPYAAVPQPLPVDLGKPAPFRQPVPKATAPGPHQFILDGVLTPPPIATSNQDYLAYTLYAPAKPSQDEFDYASPLEQRRPATFDHSSPSGTDYDYTAPPDASGQHDVEDGPSRDFVPPPEFQPPHSAEFGYPGEAASSAEYDGSREVDSYLPGSVNSGESEEREQDEASNSSEQS